jgi:hypothetical protein
MHIRGALPRSTSLHSMPWPSPPHSLTRRHGNVPRAGKHVRRVYRIGEGMRRGGARLGPCVVAAQRRCFGRVLGLLVERRTMAKLRKSQLSRVWQSWRHCQLPCCSNVCTRRAKSHRSGQGQPTERTPTPRDWRHVHVVPHVAFLRRRNTLCPSRARTGLSHTDSVLALSSSSSSSPSLWCSLVTQSCVRRGGVSYRWLVDDEMGHRLALMDGIPMEPIAA